ncbi:conserved exported hypothetical protein [Xanthomonas phaseoli pv. phaseoli]|uniref:Uncharacterized protein n=1 Tax=Xanthomonas campestris pv. phaseoli TaxID=317013 RepID=A0A7Z7J583_XANCH|nr:conserved exported hypothetical protein [Xanthomonas phaseoli pv. phaseoli]
MRRSWPTSAWASCACWVPPGARWGWPDSGWRWSSIWSATPVKARARCRRLPFPEMVASGCRNHLAGRGGLDCCVADGAQPSATRCVCRQRSGLVSATNRAMACAGWLRRRKSQVALGDVLNNFGQWPVLLTRMAGSALADPARTRRPGLGPAAVKLPAPSSCQPA